MENNEMIQNLNEGAVEQVCDNVMVSNGKGIAKWIVMAGVVVAGVVAGVIYKKRKNRIEEAEVIEEKNVKNNK